MSSRDRGYAIWLLTWSWMGDHAKPDWDRVEAVLSPRLGARQVRWFVEQRYAQRTYELDELLKIAVHPKTNRYPARFERRWEGRITCGHNPFLVARKVEHYRIGADGQPTWKEIPVPELVRKDWAGEPPFQRQP